MSIRSVNATIVALSCVLAACGTETSAPSETTRLEVNVPAGVHFERDALTLSAAVRNSSGVLQPVTDVMWSVSDTSRATIDGKGVLTLLRPGTVSVLGTRGRLAAAATVDVRGLTVQRVTVLPAAAALAPGDVVPLGVRVLGEGGREVVGRTVSLSSEQPTIATVDASSRIRAVAPGVATIRATVDGISGTAQVTVSATSAEFQLTSFNGERLPFLIAADSVSWNGVPEFHEVYVELGTLRLSGGVRPRYAVDVRMNEYNVVQSGGQRRREFRTSVREFDMGAVSYDARGDLVLTSEVVSPVRHTASPVADGMNVRFRVPGDTTIWSLLYKREAK